MLRCRSARSRPTRTSAAATTTTPSPATVRGAGMSIARGIGQVSYRSELELDAAVRPRPPGRRAPVRRRPVRGRVVPRVPRREARAPLRRQHATSCCREAMNHHDVGRGRGGIATALARITADVTSPASRPTGSTRCGSSTSSPSSSRPPATSPSSSRSPATTASSSRPSRRRASTTRPGLDLVWAQPTSAARTAAMTSRNPTEVSRSGRRRPYVGVSTPHDGHDAGSLPWSVRVHEPGGR